MSGVNNAWRGINLDGQRGPLHKVWDERRGAPGLLQVRGAVPASLIERICRRTGPGIGATDVAFGMLDADTWMRSSPTSADVES